MATFRAVEVILFLSDALPMHVVVFGTVDTNERQIAGNNANSNTGRRVVCRVIMNQLMMMCRCRNKSVGIVSNYCWLGR